MTTEATTLLENQDEDQRQLLQDQDEDQKPLYVDDGDEEHLDPAHKPLPVWRKICFAIGGAPYQTTNTVIGFFISIFLLEVAEIRPYYVSVVLFTGKVWDAITDPMCGYFVNKTDTRLGKLKPWILFSTPFGCGTYFLMWYVPDISEEGKLAWYMVFFCLFQWMLSGLHVPYTSLTMYISPKQSERDSATAYRMVSEAIGVLLAVVIQGQLVNKYRTAGECKGEEKPTEQELRDQLPNENHNYFRDLKTVLTFGPFIKLCMAFLFLSLAIAIVQGNLALFCTHTLDMGDKFADFILVLLITSIVVMPFWQRCLLKFGKKSTFAAGMIVTIFAGSNISAVCTKESPLTYYFILVVAGMSISVALLLPWSMLPDVLDYFLIHTGERKDPIFYSFYVFFSKLAIGVGLGLSQAVLEAGGYVSANCEQPSSVGETLRLLVVPGPVVFVIIALLALWSYPIDEQMRRNMDKQLEYLRKKQSKKKKHIHNGIVEEDTGTVSSVSYESITHSTLISTHSTEF